MHAPRPQRCLCGASTYEPEPQATNITVRTHRLRATTYYGTTYYTNNKHNGAGIVVTEEASCFRLMLEDSKVPKDE
jgi:hypothetical protein